MKKIILAAFAAVSILAFSGCNSSTSSNSDDALAMSRDSLTQALANQDSLLVLMTDIQSGLDEIKRLENILNVTNLNGETINRREQVRDDIAAIQQSIAERRQRLADLEARLNKSNANNAHLKQAIETLRAQIDEQVQTISNLRNELAAANIHIDELTQNVDSLNNVVAVTEEQKQAVIEANTNLTNELNTCYYVIGSKKELKEHNIIETGFLRKMKVMPEDFETGYFTTADRRTLSAIPLMTKKAKVLTNQPSSSYRFEEDANGNKTLCITNPTQFWSTTNYLVIQVD